MRRLRRMRICFIEAATPNAMAWVLGFPREVRLRYIRGTKDADVVKPGDVHSFEDKPSEEEMQARVNGLTENFGSMKDTIMTRAFLEEFNLLECFDRMIANAESHVTRLIEKSIVTAQPSTMKSVKKTRIIDDAEIKVIKTTKTSR